MKFLPWLPSAKICTWEAVLSVLVGFRRLELHGGMALNGLPCLGSMVTCMRLPFSRTVCTWVAALGEERIRPSLIWPSGAKDPGNATGKWRGVRGVVEDFSCQHQIDAAVQARALLGKFSPITNRCGDDLGATHGSNGKAAALGRG